MRTIQVAKQEKKRKKSAAVRAGALRPSHLNNDASSASARYLRVRACARALFVHANVAKKIVRT